MSNTAKEVSATTIVIKNDKIEERLESLLSQMRLMIAKIERLEKIVSIAEIPEWISKEKAKELINYKSDSELRKFCAGGVIRYKEISEGGKKKLYNREDCLSFVERLEDARQKGLI